MASRSGIICHLTGGGYRCLCPVRTYTSHATQLCQGDQLRRKVFKVLNTQNNGLFMQIPKNNFGFQIEIRRLNCSNNCRTAFKC